MRHRNREIMSSPPTSPDAALAKSATTIRQLCEAAAAALPAQELVIRGIVIGKLTSFQPPKGPGFVYGEIEDGDGATRIAFRCPRGAAPSSEGEPVLLAGRAHLKRSKRQRRYEFIFVGKKVGNWTPPPQAASLPIDGRRDRPQVSLQDLLRQAPQLPTLALIGTGTGLFDAETTASRGGAPLHNLRKLETSTAEWQRVLRVASTAAKECDALVFLRGGGDITDFSTWQHAQLVNGLLALGKPFYTALGHSTMQPTKADLFADQHFATPSDFGSAYAAAVQARHSAEQSARELDSVRRQRFDLQANVDEEKRSREDLARQLQLAESRRLKQQRIFRKVLLAAVLIVVALALTLWLTVR